MPIFVINKCKHPGGNVKRNFTPRPIINEYTITGFKNDFDLLTSQHNTYCTEKSGIELFSSFLSKFKIIYDKWFIQTSNNRKLRRNYVRKDWITVGLAKSCDIKNNLYNIWRKDRTHVNWTNYIDYKRKLGNLIAKAKFNFYRDEFQSCKTDLKKTWKTINCILGRKRRNKLLVFAEVEASHTFNKYFTSIAGNLIRDNCPSSTSNFKKYLGSHNANLLTDCEFSCSDLVNFIKNLSNNKSTYFSPRIIKSFSQSIAPTLTNIFNLCYKEGTFPNELKIAKVIPIYKNRGSIKDISNYRPISMLSLFSKLFEKLIHKRLMEFLPKIRSLTHLSMALDRDIRPNML